MGSQLAETLLHLIGEREEEFDPLGFAQQLADRAAALFPDGSAGVLLACPAHAPMVAADSDAAKLLTRLQLDHDEGPGSESLHSGSSITVTELNRHRARWPNFTPACDEHGYRAAHAFPIKTADQTVGALCLFQVRPGEPDEDVLQPACELVCAAGIRLLHRSELQRLERRTAQLQNALDSRVVVEQAKGIVAERYHLTLESAFEMLRRHARQHNKRLSEVCLRVIDTTDHSRSGGNVVRPNDFG